MMVSTNRYLVDFMGTAIYLDYKRLHYECMLECGDNVLIIMVAVGRENVNRSHHSVYYNWSCSEHYGTDILRVKIREMHRTHSSWKENESR